LLNAATRQRQKNKKKEADIAPSSCNREKDKDSESLSIEDIVAYLMASGFYDVESFGYSYIKICIRSIVRKKKDDAMTNMASIAALFASEEDRKKMFK